MPPAAKLLWHLSTARGVTHILSHHPPTIRLRPTLEHSCFDNKGKSASAHKPVFTNLRAVCKGEYQSEHPSADAVGRKIFSRQLCLELALRISTFTSTTETSGGYHTHLRRRNPPGRGKIIRT